MDLFQFILGLIQVIVYGAIALAILAIALLITVSVMPKDNPVRVFLAALLTPVGTMAAVSVIGVPIEVIPGIDFIYDIIGLVLIGRAWIQFFQTVPALWPAVMAYMEAAQSPTGTSRPSSNAIPPATECVRLGQEAMHEKDYRGALLWFRLAAQQGHAQAQQWVREFEAKTRNRAQEKSQK